MIQDKLIDIQRLVPMVARDMEAYVQARAEEAEAHRQLLERVLSLVAPALKALSTTLRVSHVRRYDAARREFDELNGTAALGERELRGVHLAGDTAPRQDVPKAPSGAYLGRGLWVLEDGRLVRLTYRGTWSQSAEDAARWEADVHLTDAAEAVRQFRVDEVVERLHAGLSRHNRQEATQAAHQRATLVRAILTLLGR